MADLEKQLPQSQDMERALLGAILINAKVFERTLSIVDVEDFSNPSHQVIYAAIAGIGRASQPIDLLTVKRELLRHGKLEDAGGLGYLSSLTDAIPNIANAERYAETIAETSRLRQIVHACSRGLSRAAEGKESPERIAADVTAHLSGVAIAEKRESRPMIDVIRDVHARADERALHGHSLAISTGYSALDSRYAVRRKVLIAAAAPSGHGKSAFELNLALNVVRSTDTASAAFYSLEMSDQEVSDRITSMLSQVPHKNIRAWKWLNDLQQKAIDNARKELHRLKARFFFADRIREIDDLYADARKKKSQFGLDAIFVDYLQLIRGKEEKQREREVNRIAMDLFAIAQELDIAVVAASQVNKDRERRTSGRLSKGDLKEASAIGEHARVVMMFQRPWEDDKSNRELRPCQVNFQLEKNNEGTTGDFEMHFDPTNQTFAEGGCHSGCRYYDGNNDGGDDDHGKNQELQFR